MQRSQHVLRLLARRGAAAQLEGSRYAVAGVSQRLFSAQPAFDEPDQPAFKENKVLHPDLLNENMRKTQVRSGDQMAGIISLQAGRQRRSETRTALRRLE